jgi:hypothetical protein
MNSIRSFNCQECLPFLSFQGIRATVSSVTTVITVIKELAIKVFAKMCVILTRAYCKLRGIPLSKALWNACISNNAMMVEHILKTGQIGADDQGKALYYAAQKGYRDTVKAFLRYGQISADDKGYALCLAAKFGHLEAGKILLAAGQISPRFIVNAINEATLSCAEMALDEAGQKGCCELVKIFLETDPITEPDSCILALPIAAYYGEAEMVEKLLKNPRINKMLIRYAIHFATVRGSLQVVLKLLPASLSRVNNLYIRYVLFFLKASDGSQSGCRFVAKTIIKNYAPLISLRIFLANKLVRPKVADDIDPPGGTQRFKPWILRRVTFQNKPDGIKRFALEN